jgi:hypothetical protein
MHRAWQSAIGLPRSCTSAELMLGFVTPPDVSNSFKMPPNSRADGPIVVRPAPFGGATWLTLSSVGIYRSASIGCLTLITAAACAVTSPAAAPKGPTYSCCQTADIQREYRPGETLAIHWIVVPGEAGAGTQSQQLELNASLAGPFGKVDELKADDAARAAVSTLTAEPVRPSGVAGEQPVSTIAIPSDAAAGFYNLVTSVSEPGGSVSGASVIRVVPAP